nr:sigma 54-interacting transcriptional regulator [Neobacillus sp. Marseille-Q6967]
MKTVGEIMTRVESCLTPGNTLFEALLFMKNSKWNTVPVIDSITTKNLVGVFTRSSLYNMLLADLNKNTPILNYIIEDVGTILVDTPVEGLDQILLDSRVGTGIVINGRNEPVGLLTQNDALKNYLQESNLLKGQLETVLHTSNLGAMMTDEYHMIIFVNSRLVEMIGLNEKNILHQKIEHLLPNLKELGDKKEIQFRVRFHSEHFIVRVSKYDMTNAKEGLIILLQNVSILENLAQELETVKKWRTILQSVIHNAYDGLVMVNEKQEIIFISPSLLELFDLHELTVENAQVEEILPHLQLSQALKTGVADISDFMEIKGITYMVHRIPVYQDDRMIGAIGKIVYRQLHEVRERFKSFENEKKFLETTDKKGEKARFTFDEIVSEDPQMEKLKRSGMKAAKGKTTVLIRGESGTGKELFAHAIHNASPYSNGPFITVNCAAIPEHLLESEFFGYEEGAFTGAKNKGKMGKFDMANGGTLFLDEIGDMSLQLQAKLLSALQERGFYRVGGTERIEVDVRIIGATNRPLEKMVNEGTFREDLFYRINVISFDLPPLRNRKKDILLLSERFIHELNKQNGTSITSWDPMVEEALIEYDWPGNIRELRNVWERAMVFAENGKVQIGDLPDYVVKKIGYDFLIEETVETRNLPLIEKAEQIAIRKALQDASGNKSKACQLLGISRSVLYDKLRKYDLAEKL